MKQIIKFKLDNPTFEKWELYKGMIPMIDQVCTENRLFIESRVPIDDEQAMIVTSFANNESSIINATVKVILLMQAHGLSATVIDAKRIRNPAEFVIKLCMKLKLGYQTKQHLDRWQSLSATTDDFAKIRSIKIEREWDLANFALYLTCSFLNPVSWTQVCFFAGHLYGTNHLYFDVDEYSQPIEQEDILDELIALSSNHRQLSFDHVLNVPEPKLIMKG